MLRRCQNRWIRSRNLCSRRLGSKCRGPPKRLTYDEIQSKTYMEVKGTGTANQCPTLTAESVSKNAPPDFQNTKLMTVSPTLLTRSKAPSRFLLTEALTSRKKDGIDYAAVTVQLPGGERRGGSTGYDNAVALPAGGRGDEEELSKENVKNTAASVGEITLKVTKSKPETGESDRSVRKSSAVGY
ncbi:hypothetical protein HID58_007966 [Brassica napus]|uniref:Uncharacterized protein n=1 Tax=Brassica napus TaxID=3708 RepID=A0ABQ7XHQ6_BRANA|nr:hypothetical protein HID58_007966 [Brassica napus]